MEKLDQNEVRRIVIHALVIVVLAAIIGLIYNALSTSGFPLFSRTPSVSPMEQAAAMGIGTITLKEAKALFDQGEALFIDARPEAAYVERHIVGALSLPYDAFEERYPEVAVQLPVDLQLITYCDGVACEESAELALLLAQLGHINVVIFLGGWPEWKNAGYPVTSHAGGRP